MGIYDRDILDYLFSHGETCQLNDLLNSLKGKQDFSVDRVLHDIKNLEKDELVDFDENTQALTLRPKAQKPVVKLPPNQRI